MAIKKLNSIFKPKRIALIGVSMSAQKSLAKNTTSTDFLNPYLECSNCEFENLFQIWGRLFNTVTVFQSMEHLPQMHSTDVQCNSFHGGIPHQDYETIEHQYFNRYFTREKTANKKPSPSDSCLLTRALSSFEAFTSFHSPIHHFASISSQWDLAVVKLYSSHQQQ